MTFFRPPPGPTITSSSLMGWRAQKGSGVVTARSSGALPVNFTLPAIVPLPNAPGPVAAAVFAGGAADGAAVGSFFLQPRSPAVRATRASEAKAAVEENRNEAGRGMRGD